eukprot:scaffold51393_cov100-Cyclotella_meneghiniana.AAC.1
MFIVPRVLLSDVHLAVSHFSKRENSQGMSLDFHGSKIPGPVICARLLELIGIPQYFRDLKAKLDSSPVLLVHSAQIDEILHCCLETVLALSNSCKTGKDSLIGCNFNFDGEWHLGGNKTAAHLCEEIWQSVSHMEILFTTDRIRQNSDSSKPFMMYSRKDERRRKQAISLFNATLAAYARLGSSTSGIQQEARRHMAQSAERMLLELASKDNTLEPSPSNILHCIRPDIISFNTAMNAWTQLTPKSDGGANDEHIESTATLTAQRSQAILETMEELWNEERSLSKRHANHEDDGFKESQSHTICPNSSSYNTVLNAWARSSSSQSLDNAMVVFRMMVDRCNASLIRRDSLMQQNSYSQYMGGSGRVSLMQQNFHSQQITNSAIEDDLVFPDSKTFVALLGCCSNMSSNSCEEAVSRIESIFDAINEWDQQLRWSRQRGILSDSNHEISILNVYVYNALIKAFSSIPTSSWEESLQCCNRIEEIISQMAASPDAITRGIAINSWIKCAEFAPDVTKKELCVEKACSHFDLFQPEYISKSKSHTGDKENKNDKNSSKSRALHSLNDIIALCGKSDMGTKANELFLRARGYGLYNLTTISTTVDALARSKDINQVEKALNHVLDLEKSMGQKNFPASNKQHDYTMMYNACIAGFINSHNGGCDKAHNLLLRMIENHSQNQLHVGRPNAHSFALVMDALAQSGRSNKVEELLKKMETEMGANVRPNIIHYNTLMTSYKVIQQNHTEHASAFNAIIKTLGRGTIEGAEKVTAILRRLEEMHRIGDIMFHPDVNIYNSILNSWQLCEQNKDVTGSISPSEKAEEILDSLCNHHKAESGLSPNDASFSICINSYCKSSLPEAADRAERIFRRKEELLNEIKGLSIRTADYNALLSKWREGINNGPARATLLFEDIVRKSNESEAYESPNDYTLNALLAVHTKSNDKRGAETAEVLLKRMDELHKANKINVRPGMISYRTVMNGYIERKNIMSPQKVEALVEGMIEKYKVEGREDLKPDAIAFDLILKACNLVPATWDVNSREHPNSNSQIIEIANRAFMKLRGKEFEAKPTHSTYSFMFRIFNRHMNFKDRRYDMLMKSLWTQACNDGCVSEFTLESLRLSVKESFFFDCIGRGRGQSKAESVKVHSLSSEWRRNVAAKRTSSEV